MRRPGKNDGMNLLAIEIFGASCRFVRILAEFAVTPIRKSAKLFTMIYPRELQRTPEQ
jgi:hypothetical protein